MFIRRRRADDVIERRYDRSVTEPPRALQRAFHAANRHIYRTTRRQLQYPVWTLPVPVLPSEEAIKAIALGEEPTAACAQRIALAKTRGGYDDMTVHPALVALIMAGIFLARQPVDQVRISGPF